MDPHDDCNADVIYDVLKCNFAALVDFNFYERCATYSHNLRVALKSYIHLLPREFAYHAVLGKNTVLLERDWPFGADAIPAGIESNKASYRRRRPMRSLKRYAIKKAILHFGITSSAKYFFFALPNKTKRDVFQGPSAIHNCRQMTATFCSLSTLSTTNS